MDYTYQFEAHLREHRPSRVGQRIWWMLAAAGTGVVVADGVYVATTSSNHLSAAAAAPPLFAAAFLFILSWAALSIADWTYPTEKHYREAQHVAACQARDYILAGRRSRSDGRTAEPPTRTGQTPDHPSHIGPLPVTGSRSHRQVVPAG